MTRSALGVLVVFSTLSGGIVSTGAQQSGAAGQKSAKSQWPSVKYLVDSKDFAGAARLAVEALEGDCPDRQYAMWKWWEANFGERKDFMELSRQFGDSLFKLYEQSFAPRRRVIVETFGRPKFDVSRSGADLRKEVEGKANHN